MTDRANNLPPEQRAIRDKCFHPSGTFVEFPIEDVETSVPARFEKIVRMYPDRIAVKTKTQQLNFVELNRAANCLAQAILVRRGTGQEPVALLLSKGTALVVAILGVLKSGKIFVLLDPTLPPPRISYMLDDSQASLVVTNGEYLPMAKAWVPENSLLDLDTLNANSSAKGPELSIRSDDLAYILYTSGSTGSPKGIVENHRNLLHYIKTQTNALHICATDRLTFLASQGRDIFRAVLNGATVYPVDIKHEGLAGLAQLLIREEISIYNSVASAFRDFVVTLTGKERFPHLRLIQLMGETIYRRDVELYRKHFSGRCVFVNGYGPNDAGMLTRYFVDHKTTITGTAVPVGYAIEDKEVFVIDENGNEVPFEHAGEIAVRSRYMAPAYWRRPELTRAAFIPISSDGTERFYRTGDVGSMAPDRCLTYLGRKDSQVKIRGNKVEIAEIEMGLLNLDVVTQAVVVAHEEVPGHKRLIAYIVPTKMPGPTVSALRSALAAKLPDYMIPSAFVMLDKFPVIGIGKIDRAALPLPDNRRPALDLPYVPPRSSMEVELTRIWSEVLAVDRVGIHDNFFDLGGHSLTTSRVISRVIQTFQLELPVKALFDAPTVAQMAAIITQNQTKRASDAELAQMLREVEAMTEEEAQKQLAGESALSSSGDRHE